MIGPDWTKPADPPVTCWANWHHPNGCPYWGGHRCGCTLPNGHAETPGRGNHHKRLHTCGCGTQRNPRAVDTRP